MAFIKRDKNEYGTPIIECSCDFCGKIFTVCGGSEHTDEECQIWGKGGCQGRECSSYNPATDMDLMFSSDEELTKEEIINIGALKNRKELKVFKEEV